MQVWAAGFCQVGRPLVPDLVADSGLSAVTGRFGQSADELHQQEQTDQCCAALVQHLGCDSQE
jgi:hypothetical protein